MAPEAACLPAKCQPQRCGAGTAACDRQTRDSPLTPSSARGCSKEMSTPGAPGGPESGRTTGAGGEGWEGWARRIPPRPLQTATHPPPIIPLVILHASPGGMGSRCHSFGKACGSTHPHTHTHTYCRGRGGAIFILYTSLTPPQRQFSALLARSFRRELYLLHEGTQFPQP